VKDPRPRAAKIRDAVAAESDAWDRATERRADIEYALEQFEESPEFDGTSERFETLSKAVHKAREEERAAERAWRGAMERAERGWVNGAMNGNQCEGSNPSDRKGSI
jgi:hypothetical protein